MTTPPRQTYADLSTEADVVGTDLIATWRSTGPLKTVTAAILLAYVETALGLGTMAEQDADAVAITGGTITGTTTLNLAGGTVVASTPLIQATQTWNEPDTVFTATKLNITSTASGATSRFVDYQLAGTSVYSVLKTGEVVISNGVAESYGGIALVGNGGEMALTSRAGSGTTFASQVFRWYWEDAGQTAAVLRGFGSNRTSFESNAAMTFISDGNRFEFEGNFSATSLQVTPYIKASANGVPLHFTNVGQTPTPAKVMMITNAFSAITNILELYDRSSGSEVIRVGFETGGTITQTIGANIAGHTITGYSLTGSNASAGISLTGTWNTSGNPNALNIAITNTASGATANLINASVGGVNLFSVTKTGQVSAALGSAAAPAFSFIGDLDVGMWSPAANTLAFSTSGTEAIRVFSTRNVSIGNTTDTDKLSVTGDIRASNRFYGVGTTASAKLDDTLGAQLTYGTANLTVGGPVIFYNSSVERFRIGQTTGDVTARGYFLAHAATAIPTGGTASLGLMFFSTANFGVFGGSGAPTLSAAKGSLYLRSDGSGINDRMYVNTNGSTTWTAVVTVA